MELDREQQEVAQAAARLIVEEGLDYAGARRKAMRSEPPRQSRERSEASLPHPSRRLPGARSAARSKPG